MALAKEDIDYIKQHLEEWFFEQSLGKPRVAFEAELRERTVRVEEELKHQRELIQQGFEQMDRRFEQVDKRIEAIQQQMDKRFEQVDKRFEQVDKQFDAITRRMDRFMIWSFGITVSAAAIVIAALRLWPPGQTL